MTKMKVLICPYCGDTQPAGDRCRMCGGLFEPLSRQATHNAMGPWFFRDEARPFQPGASYETIIKLVERSQITKYSILRGPTTKQFWTVARRVPGIAHLLGYCHNCDASVDGSDHGCHACGVPFGAYLDRNFLGLPDVRPLPWEVGGEEEQQRAPASPRTMEFRRAAEPLGISSFASDEELRSSGLRPMSGYHAASGSPGGLGDAGAASGGTATLPGRLETAMASSAAMLLESSPDGVAARAMQRRFERQRQTIKLLLISMLVLALVAIISLAALFAGQTRPPNGQPTPVQDQSKAQNTAQNGKAKAPVVSDPSSAASASAPAPTAMDHPEPQDEGDRAFDEELDRAAELIAQAEQADRPLTERIRDYDEALKLLKLVDAEAPSALKPDDLADLIARTERDLERLRLQEFFP